MRKLVSIISAVLVSLAMQATIVTQDISLASFSIYTTTVEDKEVADGSFNAETLEFSKLKAWGGGQIWYGDPGFDVSNYRYIYVELASPAATDISFSFEYTTTDGHPAQQWIIKAGKTKDYIELTGGSVKKLEIKNWSSTSNASFQIQSFQGVETPDIEITRSLWSGDNAFGNWKTGFSVNPFARVYEWDKMVITYTKESDPQCQIKINNTDAYLDFVGEYVNVSGETQASFLLSAADAEAIRTNGMWFNGKNMTIKSVSIVSYRTLSSTEKTMGNWGNYVEIDAEKLTGIQVGNDICLRVTNIAEGDYQRISLYNGWNKSDLLPGGEYFFQPGDEASSEDPFIKKIRVTGNMKQQLGTHKLLVRGSFYTVTDIYVEEGEPVAEEDVKGYLSVSAAGMATFVLPFNVPSLPAGVKAYDLTNDGSNEIVATEVNALTADQPVLIIAAEGEYEFSGGDGASADVSSKTETYANGALIGTYKSIDPLSQNDGAGNYHYVLQKHEDEVAFYQVLDNTCFISSYRAYLSCRYNANPSGPSSAPKKMRLVIHPNAPTSINDVQENVQSTKIIRDGQLIIVRDSKMYNALGQQL